MFVMRAGGGAGGGGGTTLPALVSPNSVTIDSSGTATAWSGGQAVASVDATTYQEDVTNYTPNTTPASTTSASSIASDLASARAAASAVSSNQSADVQVAGGSALPSAVTGPALTSSYTPILAVGLVVAAYLLLKD